MGTGRWVPGGSTRRGLAGRQRPPARRRADGERGLRKHTDPALLRPRVSVPRFATGSEVERWREEFAEEERSSGQESGITRAREGR